MDELAAGKLIEKKSRFYAHLYLLNTKQDINNILQIHQNRYTKANHHCYALCFSSQKHGSSEEFSDDGEVGRPGRILLQVLQHHQLHHHALVVSRVFGGIKLGVGGVSRAFRKSGEGVVNLYQSSKA